MKSNVNKKEIVLAVVLAAIVVVFWIIIARNVLFPQWGDPLNDAYDNLQSDLMSDATSATGSEYLVYDSDNKELYVRLSSSSDADAIFDVIDDAVDGKDIGQLQIDYTGSSSDSILSTIDERIGSLKCTSADAIGVSSDIAEANSSHNWTKVLNKTDTLYIESLNAIKTYDSSTANRLKNVRTLQIYYNPKLELDGITRFKNVKTLIFGGNLVTAADTEIFRKSEQDSAETTSSSSDTDTSDVTVSMTYYSTLSSSVRNLADLNDLKTILLYPDLKYKLDSSGEQLITTLQIVTPNVKINPPEQEYSGESDLKTVSDVSTPNVTTYTKSNLLADLLEEDAKSCYTRGEKFRTKSGKAKLNGKSLVYYAYALSSTDEWSSSKKFYSSGQVVLTGLDIDIPTKLDDYDTFIYIYPTFTYAGKYNTGTKGYTQTLYVQVYDLEKKIKYKPVKVGSAKPPSTMHYIKGYMPKKYAGTVSSSYAFSYIEGLD